MPIRFINSLPINDPNVQFGVSCIGETCCGVACWNQCKEHAEHNAALLKSKGATCVFAVERDAQGEIILPESLREAISSHMHPTDIED